MCGLNGAFGQIDAKEKAVLNLLSMFSQLRGRHSTGVGLVYKNRQRKPVVAKAVGGQESLANAEPTHFDRHNWSLKANDLRCVIGHNRFATQGVINVENAHPFIFKDVVGCHNGTISPYSLTQLDEHNYKRTDSQIIMAQLGEDTPVNDVIEFAQGAWALVWYDYKKHTLHMCRNKERTLYVCMSLDKKTILWASEAWMLNQALANVGLTKKYNEVMNVEIDKHLTFSTERHNLIALRVGPAVGGKSKPLVTPINKSTGWWPNRILGRGSKVVPITKNVTTTAQVAVESDYKEDYTKGFDGVLLHRRKFEKLIKEGCNWCTGSLHWNDRDKISWFSKDEPICCDCAQHLRDKYDYNLTNEGMN